MTPEQRHDLRFPMLAIAALLGAMAMAGMAALQNDALDLRSFTSEHLLVLLLLVFSVVIAELLDVAIPGAGAISMSYPLYVATAVYFGPLYAGIAALASVIPVIVARRRSGWQRLVFNAGQMTMTAMAPGLVYVALGGRPLFDSPSQVLAPLLFAGAIGTVVNLGLGGLGVSFLYGEPLSRVWAGTLSWMLPSQVVLGFVGLAIAEVLFAVGMSGFALFVLPLIVARQTYQQSVKLREAYTDTISSLVAALEAKDVYTKGHSMRVAEYAVLIAGELALDDHAIDRIRYAALLHDLGKVGVSRRVLAKESRLSEAEYDEIKRHPHIGAHILEDVPYLADLVPAIEAHHERLDGSGYGRGLFEADIPLSARILSVADAYDAMTSQRPYRGAMTHLAATEQLHLGVGTQFDAGIVDAFERAWKHEHPEARIDAAGEGAE